MDLRYIKLEVKEGIGWVQFNRPDKLNALNPEVFEDLESAVRECEGKAVCVNRVNRDVLKILS